MANLHEYCENSKYGFKDENGVIVIPAQYDAVSYSFNKRITVRINNKCGIISQEGKVILDFIYDDILQLKDDLYVIRENLSDKDWQCYVINESGEIIIPIGFKYIYNVGSYIQCFKKAKSEFGSYSFRVNRYSYNSEEEGYVYNKLGYLIREGVAVAEEGVFLLFQGGYNNVIAFNVNKATELSGKYQEIHYVKDDIYIVRKKLESNEWFFGVINQSEEILIPYDYKYIKDHKGNFFQCCKVAECNRKSYGGENNKYYYTNLASEVWYNADGQLLHEGEAKCLSETLLAIFSNGKWGVINNKNKKIVNYFYDEIDFIAGNIVVKKDHNIGLLGQQGELIITPSYKSIECVYLQEGTFTINVNEQAYGCYSQKYSFDTDGCAFDWRGKKTDWLFRKKVFVIGDGYIQKCGEQYFSADKLLILTTDEYSELYSVEKGLIPNSRFDEINQITDQIFCVKRDGLYGIFKISEENLIIPCEYSRIRYEGAFLLLLCKDGKWGAKSLLREISLFRHIYNADFEPKFLEIKLLTNTKHLFSVKTEVKHYDDEIECFYSIADARGELLDIGKYDEHLVWFNKNKIKALFDGKYGFVSLDGFISIPFKYDNIELRKDGNFDVRVNESWGVMDIEGREFIPVKYAEKLPEIFKDQIVIDSISYCKGILDNNGKERIPTLYEHLLQPKSKEIIFFGKGGYESDTSNFFSEITNAKWGALDKDGKIIIPPKYDCFKFDVKNLLLAGRDGHMLGEGQHSHSYYESEYSGVYDLYTFEGKLIIGGFTEFQYDFERKLYLFKFGGKWKSDCEDYDKWGNAIFYYSYHFEKGNSRWIVLDEQLVSIAKKKDGKREIFKEGFIGTITRKEEEGKVINYWNMALELFSINRPKFNHNLMICDNDKFQCVIRLEDGAQSNDHDNIQVISTDLYYFLDIYDMGRGVGISRFTSNEEGIYKENIIIEPLVEGTCILTNPIEGFVFGVYNYDHNLCRVTLYNINNPNFKPIVAIDSIDEEKLMDYISRGLLLISIDEKADDTKRIVVPKLNIFDKSFIELISISETNKTHNPFTICYWFTDDHHLNKPSFIYGKDYDHDDHDDYDYMRDSWDAMTDGMYGDMPDDFDGDFDFLGR